MTGTPRWILVKLLTLVPVIAALGGAGWGIGLTRLWCWIHLPAALVLLALAAHLEGKPAAEIPDLSGSMIQSHPRIVGAFEISFVVLVGAAGLPFSGLVYASAIFLTWAGVKDLIQQRSLDTENPPQSED